VREVCEIDTPLVRSAHRWPDPHTGIAGSRPAPAADSALGHRRAGTHM